MLGAFASATPLIVDLQANWKAPPYEVSVLEAITGENNTAFYPMLSAYVAINEGKGRQTDEGYRKELVSHALEVGMLNDKQVEYVDLSLALHKHSATIQAYYQYFDTNVDKNKKKCENVFVCNGKESCDKDSVFALETGASRDVELLPGDRVLGDNTDAPIAILYADISSESFPVFHSHLVNSAINGKIQYILRYKPSKIKEKENLSGYGMEVAVKRTDYIVIDDRNEKDKNKDKDKKEKKDEIASNVQISKDELENLGLRTSSFIMNSKNKFDTLMNISLDFPNHVEKMASIEVNEKIMDDLKNNSNIMSPGQNALLINGAHAFEVDTSIFALIDTIEKERKFIDQMKQFDLETEGAAELVRANLVGSLNSSIERYDYRTPGLIWLNDLQKDKRYEEFPDDIELFLNEDFPGEFYPIRHNALSIVVAIDFSAAEHMGLLSQLMMVMTRGAPIQFGVIPLTNSYDGKNAAKDLAWLEENGKPGQVQKYIMTLMQGVETGKALKTLLGEKQDVNTDQVKSVIDATKGWIKKMDITEGYPMILANGIPIKPTRQWLMEASEVVTEDLPDIRKIVKAGLTTKKNPIRDQLLENAFKRRNNLITPSDPSEVEYVDTSDLFLQLGEPVSTEFKKKNVDKIVTAYLTGDFADKDMLTQLIEVMKFGREVEYSLKLVVNPIIDQEKKDTTNRQERRKTVVDLLQSLGSVRNRILINGFEALEKYLEDQQPVDEALIDECGWTSKFQQTKNVNKRLSDENTKKLIGTRFSLNSNLVVAGRLIKITETTTLSTDDLKILMQMEKPRIDAILSGAEKFGINITTIDQDKFTSQYTKTYHMDGHDDFFLSQMTPRVPTNDWTGSNTLIEYGSGPITITAAINPLSERGQQLLTYIQLLSQLSDFKIQIYLNPTPKHTEMPLKRFYRGCIPAKPSYNENGDHAADKVEFDTLNNDMLYNAEIHTPNAWSVDPEISTYDLENIVLNTVVQEDSLNATYELRNILVEGHSIDKTLKQAPRGLALELGTVQTPLITDTSVMANLGYLQFQSNPGWWTLKLREGRSSEVYTLNNVGLSYESEGGGNNDKIWVDSMTGVTVFPKVERKKGQEHSDVLEESKQSFFSWGSKKKDVTKETKKHADINIFTVASGHLYERFLSIMTASVMKHTNHTVKFWLIEQFLSPSFKKFLPTLAKEYGFEYELVTYKWPHWLRAQQEKQRTIWGYKILFLDVLFPQSLDKVIFVDADQIVRTDLKELVDLDLQGAPYGYTPMCDSREEMEGFRFWKQGYWKKLLGDEYKYHISALYVIDLVKFRQMAAGDRIRSHYQQLSADKNSLSNLDQDLPNNLQSEIPIFSLPQDWLWCETWCSDESLTTAKTIDLCNNPLTKEPKLARARRQVPEWTAYDDAIGKLHEQDVNEENEDDKENEEGEEVAEVEADHDEL